MLLTMPWCWASSASSRGVQTSTGRPSVRGEQQARLTIWTICSAEKIIGRPERGASARVVATALASWDGSASAAARIGSASAQRSRHFWTVKGEQSSSPANGSIRAPSATRKMMRTRKTSACGQECWRSKRSRTARCGGETVIERGCGPDICVPICLVCLVNGFSIS